MSFIPAPATATAAVEVSLRTVFGLVLSIHKLDINIPITCTRVFNHIFKWE